MRALATWPTGSQFPEITLAIVFVGKHYFRCTIAPMTVRPLNLAQAQFVDELLKDPARNASAAYERVYATRGKSAGNAAHRLMQDPRIVAEIQRREEALRKEAHLSAKDVLDMIRDIATADPRDLAEHRRGACRHCHGIDFKYQRRPSEYQRDLDVYLISSKGRNDPMGIYFDIKGGLGFNAKRAPNADCPECDGEGVSYAHFKDLRDLTPAQARLIKSIKQTDKGLEIKTRDQDAAVALMAKNLGLLREKDADENSDIPPAGTVAYTVEDASLPDA